VDFPYLDWLVIERVSAHQDLGERAGEIHVDANVLKFKRTSSLVVEV
jgi:hypothetical protein